MNATMKNTLLLLILGAVAALLLSAKPAALEFAEREFDFGTVPDSHAPIVHEFEFTNVSAEPVAILSVTTGCGCTRPKYPLEPVKAGKSAKIKITFLPKGQKGEINKDIRVRFRGAKARSSQRVTLRIHGHVTPPAK